MNPPYRYLPGQHPHPQKKGGYREGVADPVAKKIDPKKPEENETFQIAVRLFNDAYYWESHLYLEALWNAHARTGPIAKLMKVFILFAAAGIKMQQGKTKLANVPFQKARELIRELLPEMSADSPSQNRTQFLGVNLNRLETAQMPFQI